MYVTFVTFFFTARLEQLEPRAKGRGGAKKKPMAPVEGIAYRYLQVSY
jgi:hypothetical protein